MKKLLLISTLFLFSCSTYKMNDREIKNLKYEVDGWDIIKDGQCVANISFWIINPQITPSHFWPVSLNCMLFLFCVAFVVPPSNCGFYAGLVGV